MSVSDLQANQPHNATRKSLVPLVCVLATVIGAIIGFFLFEAFGSAHVPATQTKVVVNLMPIAKADHSQESSVSAYLSNRPADKFIWQAYQDAQQPSRLFSRSEHAIVFDPDKPDQVALDLITDKPQALMDNDPTRSKIVFIEADATADQYLEGQAGENPRDNDGFYEFQLPYGAAIITDQSITVDNVFRLPTSTPLQATVTECQREGSNLSFGVSIDNTQPDHNQRVMFEDPATGHYFVYSDEALNSPDINGHTGSGGTLHLTPEIDKPGVQLVVVDTTGKAERYLNTVVGTVYSQVELFQRPDGVIIHTGCKTIQN